MKKSTLLLCGILFLNPFQLVAKTEIKTYKSRMYTSEYTLVDGRLEGAYKSNWGDGKVRAEGNFRNNYRTGTWKYYDYNGKLLVQRTYLNPFQFRHEFPIKDSVAAKLEAKREPVYSLTTGKEGFIRYYFAKEEDVVVQKRIWRIVRKEENPILFSKEALYKLLIKGIKLSDWKAYSPADDNFQNEIKWDDLAAKLKSANSEVTGFKIKEDWFYDSKRKVSEFRIVGICPVLKFTNEKTETDFCWIYFPDLRSTLSNTDVEDLDEERIYDLDDLFFFRHFYGKIIKESNVYDRAIADYRKGNEIDEEAWRVECELVENEMELWEN